MIDLKNWKTDIKVKLPRIHWIKPKHTKLVADNLLVKYITIAVVVSPVAWWQIYQWLRDLYQWAKPIFELLKPLLEKLQ